MALPPCYEREPYRSSLATEVVSGGREGERSYVLLADTLFYPEGGGQPADRGSIDSVPVLDVQKRGGEIRHYVEREIAPGPVALELDWARRFDHMQQHTGQHLLSALAEDRCGWKTTSFHLQAGLCDVELDAAQLPAAELAALAEAVARAIRAALAVRPLEVEAADLSGLAVRTRGLPEGHQGPVRLIEIEGIDRNTCGGTHLRCTAELELLHLVGSEPMRGGTRLQFVAGGRARRWLAEKEAREQELRALLGVPASGLVAAVRGRLEEAREAGKRERALAQAFALATAEALAARPERALAAHLDAADAALLQACGRRLAELAPERAVLLTAGGEGEGLFLVAAGADAGLDLRTLGGAVATLLEGRGGGDGRIYQGKARSFARREAAMAALAAALDGRGAGARPT